MRDSVVPANQQPNEKFREQRRRRRIPSDDKAKKPKPSEPTPESRDPRLRPKGEVPTKNIFAPLRSDTDVESTLVEDTSETPNSEAQQPSSSKAGSPPPIVLTSTTNLVTLQKHIKDIVTGNFEFRNTRSGT
jgi:hypothetical protein